MIVDLETSAGKIVLELDKEKAPVSVENFVSYVNDGFYVGTIFHRVIKDFVIQGGGLDEFMDKRDTKAPIKNEAGNGLSNQPMTISMARTNDPHSATSQFFINLADNSRLDHREGVSDGYAVFGKVTEGEDVVKKVAGSATTTKSSHQNVPEEPIVIRSASVRFQ